MKGLIISATSDIATEMCLQWKKKGCDLTGTYFSKDENYSTLERENIPLFYCDLSNRDSVDNIAVEMKAIAQNWDFVLFATGSQVPVGPFEKVDIDTWCSSLELNYLNQIRLLHHLLPIRSTSTVEKSVLFFAGGGTNNAVNNYSAYTLSKIGLIKACELFDSEIQDVKFSIIGPGWVKTKIHQATLESSEEWVGSNFAKTKEKLNSDDCVPITKVIDSFEWILSHPKNIVGGRNFSTVFDQWGTEDLEKLLTLDENMYKLRRCKNDILVKSE